MRLGFSEIVLLLAIGLILLGPTVLPRVIQWYRRAEARQTRAARRRAAEQAERQALRAALLARMRVTALVVLVGGSVLYVLTLVLGPVEWPPVAYTPVSDPPAQSSAPVDPADTIDLSGWGMPLCLTRQEDWLYAGLAASDGSGKVVRVRTDGTSASEVLTADGPVTGLAFGPDGCLYLSVAAAGGTLAGGGAVYQATFDGWGVSVTPLITAAGGQRLTFPTAVAVAADGTVYFAQYAACSAAELGGVDRAFYTELLAHTATGSVWAYDPDAGEGPALVADGWAGAGGLALSADDATLYLSETMTGRVWALDAGARDAGPGDAALVGAGLPGYAAGLARTSDGTVWAAVCGGRASWVDGAAGNTLLRRMVMRLPRLTQAWLLRPQADAARAFGFSADGALAQSAAVTAEGGCVTAVCEAENGLWLAEADTGLLVLWQA